MMSLSLGNVTLSDYHLALQSDHWVSVSGQLLDLNHNYVADFSNDLWDGQVNIDADGDISRNATLKILDPTSTYGLDSRTPMNGAMYLDRMVRIVYTIWTWWMANPVSCVIFCGPIATLDRDGVFINLTANGKEWLAKDAAWDTVTYKKNSIKRDAIIDMMVNRSGETRYDIPSYPEALKALPADLAIAKDSILWDQSKTLADGMSLHFFYDGRGTLRLRQFPSDIAFSFVTGRGGSIITDPKVAYDESNAYNLVNVQGTTSGSKAIDVFKVAPASHPLSPQSLGRNGKLRYKVLVINDDTIADTTTANTRAQTELDNALMEVTTVTTDSLVIPHLDPNDMVEVQNQEFISTVRLKQYSIPILPAGTSSIGYNRKVSNRLIINRAGSTGVKVA